MNEPGYVPGITINNAIPAQVQTIVGGVKVGFSPKKDAEYSCEELVLEFIKGAKFQLRMCDYEFTSETIAEALIEAKSKGIDVQIVSDHQAGLLPASLNRKCAAAGIPIRLDKHYHIFHHKFIVRDGVDVETGSFNYTVNATEHNAENSIVLFNQPEIAKIYLARWAIHWDESEAIV